MDKVAGLAYHLFSTFIPAYYGKQSEEDAWTALVDVVEETYMGDFLFLYLKPGDGNKIWQPSWNQVITDSLPTPLMRHVVPDPEAKLLLSDELIAFDYDIISKTSDIFHGRYIIESAFVAGLSWGDSQLERQE